jgi:hypothetical protein
MVSLIEEEKEISRCESAAKVDAAESYPFSGSHKPGNSTYSPCPSTTSMEEPAKNSKLPFRSSPGSLRRATTGASTTPPGSNESTYTRLLSDMITINRRIERPMAA